MSKDTSKKLYVCNRKRCRNCYSVCNLTSDVRFAAIDDTIVIADGITGAWIPCSERLPNEGEVVLVCMRIESHKAEWEEQRSIEFGRISSDRYDYHETGWEWLNESGADYWQADWNNSILAWMPLPKPWKGADDEASD